MKKPIIISGPCSAETEEQTLKTCCAIAKTGKVDILRAGIWKPRTFPNCFEGVGEIGLKWLAKAKKITGLPVAVEVANKNHIEKALDYGVDYLWIGARTTVSPFSVQDIADSLRGTRVNVLIKNPINPDVELWSGAVERIAKSVGIENVGIIHRGFSSFVRNIYRNQPIWHLVFEMRRKYPQMVIFCDPSHICGNRENILEVSQKAADLNYDGLIIESHICPDGALSDSQQQLTPHDLEKLLDSILWREKNCSDREFLGLLNNLRREIDQIDSEIFELLSKRMKIAQDIGKAKLKSNVAILQSERWNSIVDKIIIQNKKLNLSEDFMRTILNAIHSESINHQNIIMNSERNVNSSDI